MDDDAILALIRGRLASKINDFDDLKRQVVAKPATREEIAAGEAILGFELPPLLKRIYGEIGRSGFGPGCGLMGLSPDAPDTGGATAPRAYRGSRSFLADWPDRLLPICQWGSGITSCVDCAMPPFAIRIHDPNRQQDFHSCRDALFDEAPSFADWIRRWAEGEDLWEATHGENGSVFRALVAREAG
jgi:hypothetical protein